MGINEAINRLNSILAWYEDNGSSPVGDYEAIEIAVDALESIRDGELIRRDDRD